MAAVTVAATGAAMGRGGVVVWQLPAALLRPQGAPAARGERGRASSLKRCGNRPDRTTGDVRVRADSSATSSSSSSSSSFSSSLSSSSPAATNVATPALTEPPAAVLEQPRVTIDLVDNSISVADHGVAGAATSTAASCPVPDFKIKQDRPHLFEPFSSMSNDPQSLQNDKPVLVYVPGMDCTGACVRPQVDYITKAGYDLHCLYIPASDRSSWSELVATFVPELEAVSKPRVRKPKLSKDSTTSGPRRHITLLAESFGTCLALRLASAAPEIIDRVVLINPGTNFQETNPIMSLAAASGLLAYFPMPLYQLAQDIALPLLVKRNRVNTAMPAPNRDAAGNDDRTIDNSLDDEVFSPIDYVPAPAAAWRFNLMREGGLTEGNLAKVPQPVLLVCSAKDRVLPSLQEGARLQRHLPNAHRFILTESGHTPMLEFSVDIIDIMERNGFSTPGARVDERNSTLAQKEKVSMTDTPFFRRYNDVVDDGVFDALGGYLTAWKVLTAPKVYGSETLPNPNTYPARPVLFVGNHTLFGVYDTHVLLHELFLRGFKCRSLAHPGHFMGPFRQIFEKLGAVKATPRAAYRLLQQKENVLLFPGGAREVSKRKGEQYKLSWKEQADFVRLASRFEAIIVPFSLVGGDEAFEVLADADDILSSPVGPLVRRLYEQFDLDPNEAVSPISRLPGPLPIPSVIPVPTKLQRIYIKFGQPVDTADYSCDAKNNADCERLYATVQTAVEEGMQSLLIERESDPERELVPRLAAKLSRLLPNFMPRLTVS